MTHTIATFPVFRSLIGRSHAEEAQIGSPPDQSGRKPVAIRLSTVENGSARGRKPGGGSFEAKSKSGP